jgi:hypothetical protein
MKQLLENWREYKEGPSVFYVDIEKLLPTEELGGGSEYECPGAECESAIDDKIAQIMGGNFEPITVCHQKPVNVARLKNKEDYAPPPKNPDEEPFYYILDGHHRVEAARRIGLLKVPAKRDEG